MVDGRETTVSKAGFVLGESFVDHLEISVSVCQDEIIVPILSVVHRESFDEAIELINNNSFAIGTTFLTCDEGETCQFELRAIVGVAGINVPIPMWIAHYPLADEKRHSSVVIS